MDTTRSRPRRWPWVAGAAVIGGALAAWFWLGDSKSQEAQARRAPAPTPVVIAAAEKRDVPVRLVANGTATALQSVELRSQITSTVREVHIREGDAVARGDLLFTLDGRAQEAELRKAEAQVAKDRADLANARRNLARQRELFEQKFVSQAALDEVQNQADALEGQLAVDQAAVEAARVQIAYTTIRAPFAGRTGAIGVRPGSLVQPNGAVLVSIAQVNPIAVTFTLPEKELPGLQAALAGGAVEVVARPQVGAERWRGRVSFVDNAVETATGTIRVKAEFDNPRARLWPGMYVNVELAYRTLEGATVIPVQAVQTGPDARFVYAVGADQRVTQQPVRVAYLDERFAAVEGIEPGTRVVVEGAQNLRPGSAVAEARREAPQVRAEGEPVGTKR